ncbi:hypothetical protein EMPG_17908 [Blastomyces silverae]|uniref:Protein kinase domain-containing protein n=1 Tax=Blastomyces silverae TaxID=2060906 RepID=A0A0H1B592_9EURO|nr:hypothetical protein EMPG_17908 [Blastomyces silverae]
MASRLNAWRSAFRNTPSSSRPTRNIALPRETPMEEEALPYYKPEHYYPIWDLSEGKHLFGDIFDNGGHDPLKHLALMVALIGPPPSEFVRRSETTKQCFDPSGKSPCLLLGNATIPSVSLESLESRLSGQEKESFIQFMRSMLKWLPEERRTARQLLQDPWLL